MDIENILTRLNDLNGRYDDGVRDIERTDGIEGGDVNRAYGIEGGDVNKLKAYESLEESIPSEQIWENFFDKYFKEHSSNPSKSILSMFKTWSSVFPSASSQTWLPGRPVKVYFSDDTDIEITIYVPAYLDLQAYFDDESSLNIDEIKLSTGIGIDIKEFTRLRQETVDEEMDSSQKILGLSIKIDDIKKYHPSQILTSSRAYR